MRGAEMDELVALSEARDLVLMPGHLLLYHPGVQTLKELIDSGALGDVLYLYGNRVNLGVIRPSENAIWSLGVHDLSVILYLLDEEPDEAVAEAGRSSSRASRTSSSATLRFPSGKIAHMHLSWLDPHKLRKMTVVGTEKQVVFDDMEPEWKVTVYENAPERIDGGWKASPGDVSKPAVALDEPLRLECEHFLALVRGEGDRRKVARDGAMVVRALEKLTESLVGAEVHPTAIVHEGTILGDGVRVLEYAVVGKQPVLSPRSTAKRELLAPTVIGDGAVVSTGAIVFAGTTVGARAILGDQSCVRERCVIGDDVVVGRGSLVENDTAVGARTTIQAGAYVTAYSTLEEDVFIAPCVVTTNDNFMGRTERRHELIKGPTIRRGARVGGGAILCPGVEIGEEAFVGAGAVVTKDVPPRTVVVGVPARVLRDVPEDELLP